MDSGAKFQADGFAGHRDNFIGRETGGRFEKFSNRTGKVENVALLIDNGAGRRIFLENDFFERASEILFFEIITGSEIDLVKPGHASGFKPGKVGGGVQNARAALKDAIPGVNRSKKFASIRNAFGRAKKQETRGI